MLRIARIVIPVALVALLVGLVIRPAAADTTYTEIGDLARRQTTVTVTCPQGEQFVSGMVDYSGPNRRLLGSAQLAATSDPAQASAPVPDKARSYTATYTCEPIPAAPTYDTVSNSGTFGPDGSAIVVCLSGHPYLWSVSQLEMIDPSTGQVVPIGGYTVLYDNNGDPNGIQVAGPPFWGFQLGIVCTDTWPQPPA